VAEYPTDADADTDWDAILIDAGLADAEIADDHAPASDETITLSASPIEEEYRRLCAIADRMRELGANLRQARVTFDLMRSQSAAAPCSNAAKGIARTRAAQVTPRTSRTLDTRSWKSTTSTTSRKAVQTIPSRWSRYAPTATRSRPAAEPARNSAWNS